MFAQFLAWARRYLEDDRPVPAISAQQSADARVLSAVDEAGMDGATPVHLMSLTGMLQEDIFLSLIRLEADGQIVSAWSEDYIPRRRIYRRRGS